RKRAELVQRYNKRFLEANLDLILPFASLPELKEPSYHIYPIVLPAPEDRDSVADLLKAEGIQTSIHYPPIHHFSAFRRTTNDVHLPVTEAFASRELTLPLYPSLPPAQVDAIASAVTNAMNDTTRAHHK